MKTTIEISGFEVKIEEMDGAIMISVAKDGEIIEEMEIGSEEDFVGQDEEEVQDFQEFEEEEDENEEEEDEEDEEDEEEEEEDEEFEDEDEEELEETQKEAQLESFSNFIKRRR